MVGFGGITITKKVSRSGDILREARIVSASPALRKRLKTIGIEKDVEKEKESIVLSEGKKRFTGTLDPETGEILGVRTVTVKEQEERERQRRRGREAVLTEGVKTFVGRMQRGKFIGVRTVTQREQQLRESERKGFFSIDPRIQRLETPKQKAEVISEQLALRRALPVATTGVPLERKIKIKKKKIPSGEIRKAPEPTSISRIIMAGEKLQQQASRERVLDRTVMAFGFEAAGQTTQAAGEFAESFVETIKRPETAVVVGGTLLLTRSPQIAEAVQIGLTALLPVIGVEKLRQIGRGEETFAGAAGEFGAFAAAFKAGELALEAPGFIRSKAREIKLTRGFRKLERGVMLEEPFRLVEFEETVGIQRDLFGRPVPEAQVRRALREVDINKIGFGIERNPLRPLSEDILPTGQQRLVKDIIVGISKVTSEIRPVRIIERQPFIFEPKTGKFVEFVPQGEFSLITMTPQQGIRARVDLLDTSIQTRLVEPTPPSRIFRRLPSSEKLSSQELVEPKIFSRRGVDTVSLRRVSSQDLLFRTVPVQETFLEPVVEPLPTIPRITKIPKTRHFLLFTGLGLREQVGVKERVSPLEISAVGLLGTEAFKLDVTPQQRVDIFQRVKPRILPREALDIGQTQAQDIIQEITPVTPTLPPPPPLPDFDITKPPRQPPIEPPPLLFPKLKLKQKKTKERLYDPFEQEKLFVPSLTAFELGLRGKLDEKKLFAGFELRPITKKVTRLL